MQKIGLLLALICCQLSARAQHQLQISHLDGDFYIFTTYQEYGGQPFPANGMYVLTPEGALLFDTPWDTTQFQPLLDSIQQRHGQQVIFCLATHFHEDRSGGLEYYRDQEIMTFTTAMTDDYCSRNNMPKAQFSFDNDTTFHIGGKIFRVFYPGAGHTPDNVVAWFPKERVLYGGCLVKSTDSKGLGNLSDADLKAWPLTIRTVMQECPDPAYVIPGHQGWNDTNALQHTLDLLRKHKRR